MSASPTPAQARWMELGYGLFLHYGPGTFEGVSIGDGTFPASQVCPEKPDVRSWAELAAQAGMRYAVLTAKHVDGFCLWPSALTDYSVASTPSGCDVAAEFVEAFTSLGLKVGFYYALWDRNCPFYEQDGAYAEYVRDQVQELLTRYGDVVELWFDGAWDKDHPTRDWRHNPEWETRGERWGWEELYGLCHRLQPECLVIQNSSSDHPGIPNYMPVDARTAENFDFVCDDEVRVPRVDPVFDFGGGEVFLPLEYCATLTPDWFWKSGACYNHPSVDAIRGWRRQAASHRANLLLNAAPAADGRIPAPHRSYLLAARTL